MKIIHSSNCAKAEEAIISRVLTSLTNAIQRCDEILWLLSGGSAINIEAKVASLLSLSQKKHISLGQIDERFVPIGSTEHNWQQLIKSGLKPEDFSAAWPILQPAMSIEECARNYQKILAQAFTECNFALGIYGIGADGHTAGIKPTNTQSDFKRYTGTSLVTAYSGADFQRITTTASVIKKLDEIDIYCCGANKTETIEALKTAIANHKMPAQLLKKGKNVVIFT